MADHVDINFFEQALAEEGLTGVDVSRYRDSTTMSEVIHVTKTVNGERVAAEESISDRQIEQTDDIKKHMATLAARMARQFDEALTEQHNWGEKCVKLDLTEDFTASCLRCGAEVSMDNLERGSLSMAETAVPRPSPPSYEALPAIKLRMTLLALLKGECRAFCPNSPMNEKDARFDRKV